MQIATQKDQSRLLESFAQRERELQNEFHQLEQKWIEKSTKQEEHHNAERYGLQIQLEQLSQLQIATQKDQSRLLESFAERERELKNTLLIIEQEKSVQLQIHVEREGELKEQIIMATKAGQESELVAISMQAEIDSMLDSRFWRITSPLRKIMGYKPGLQRGLKQKIAKNTFNPVLIYDYELNKINTEKRVEMNNIEDLIELYGEGFIRAAYLTVLGREPDSKGFMDYLKKLNKGEHKLEILYQLRNSKEGKEFNTKLYGLDETIRRYKISKLPLMGWVKPSSENLDYKLRMLENQLFDINSHTLNDQYDSLKAKIVEREHYIADKEVYIAMLLQELAESRLGEVPSRSLLTDELIVITGVPYDDVGGGQRGAQLARCALKTGRKVIYIYVYPKFDFDLNQHVESKITIFGLTHVAIDNITPIDMLNMVSSSATVVVEFPHPKILPYLDMAKNRGIKTVFELIDDWETSLGGDWFDLDVYKKFVAKTDVVVGTAKILVERLVNLGRDDALYLPNAANEYIFDKYKTYTRPIDFPSQGKRTALYFGSLYGEWFSWEHVIAAAEHNININLNILLIGDNPGKKDLPSNVYFLGAKQIDDLPGYLAYSDVAILPFVPGKISDAVSPIKVFEYLFSGKPVVSTRLPEIQDYPGVFIADDVNQFAKLCSTVSVTDELINNNDTFIAQNSWFYRLDQIVEKQKSENDQNISAVILIHNNKKIIGRCLETLILHGKNHLKEIIVVDNASSDGGAEYVERTFPNVCVIKNPVNGCSSGRNLGASVATGKYLVFFDSDQWFTSGSFFNEALCLLESNADVGAVAWGAGWFDSARTDMGGMIADYCPNRAMNSDAMRHGYRTDIGYLATCGFFIPKVTYDATGGFDTFYDPTCFEDTDLSFKIKQLGLNIAYRDLTGIRHQPHQTTQANSNSDKYNNLFNRNANYFKKKWEDNPSFFVDYPSN